MPSQSFLQLFTVLFALKALAEVELQHLTDQVILEQTQYSEWAMPAAVV